MSNIKRKPRPQPPWWYWTDADNCWACKNGNNCSGCKRLKKVVAEQKSKKRKLEVE